MKTIGKTLLSLTLSLFVGLTAFAQTTDQDKKQDKDKYKHKKEERTSQVQDSQVQEDLTAYDNDQDGRLDEQEFVAAYTEVEENASAETGVEDREMSTDREQDEEFISSRFETIDEDGDGYVDDREFKSWINDTDTK